MMGGGSPQTFSQGGNPATYIPQAQPQMDALFQSIIGQFPTTPGATPAGQFYPTAQNLFSGYLNPLQTGNLGSTLANLGLQGSYGAYNIGTGAAPQLGAAGRQVLNTAFDPQQALYNRTLGQTLDQASVANAMAGLGGTPYGASNIANQARNFGIDWQNNLLNRQIAGGQAGSGLDQAATSLMAGAGMLPYQTGLGIGQNALQGINAVTQLGNQQFTLPQQVLQDLESYLRLGQSASLGALQGGNLGFNQTAQGIGGLLSGANSLFGSNGLFGGSGGLFGGGSSALAGGGGTLSDAALANAPFQFSGDASAFGGIPVGFGGDVGGAGNFISAAAAPLDSGGGGFFSALPFSGG